MPPRKRPAAAASGLRTSVAPPASLKKRPSAAATGARPSNLGGRTGSGRCVFVCSAGAGGGRSRQALLKEFGDLYNFDFSGRPNLTSPELEKPFLLQFAEAACKAADLLGRSRPLYLVGHSFGSRAAVHLWGRAEMRRLLPPSCRGIIAFGYPLLHPTQHREKKLLELPASTPVLFISGTRDAFAGDFSLLKATLARAACGRKCALVKIEGGDHSLKCPASLEEQAVEAIRRAASLFIKKS
eukprot:gnl/TRDRNA2_/TRDRNA2_203627_c0_seq1.p1 gnl/TRDRNA2_/TRDRNA2_203627_c0~~gnl/TRDRNA2_/TRDRNA2_203627_c0_seq1.p1  ORF type:complete len:241 (-),score=29.93 gnl/TRDRNA2_/TRDRNA2_203627_c0_seq1:56-778(-)